MHIFFSLSNLQNENPFQLTWEMMRFLRLWLRYQWPSSCPKTASTSSLLQPFRFFFLSFSWSPFSSESPFSFSSSLFPLCSVSSSVFPLSGWSSLGSSSSVCYKSIPISIFFNAYSRLNRENRKMNTKKNCPLLIIIAILSLPASNYYLHWL